MNNALDGLQPYYYDHLKNRISKTNAITIIDYILSMKVETNLSDDHRRGVITTLKLVSQFLDDKPFQLDQPWARDSFSVTAARIRAFNACSSIFSPSWKSMARFYIRLFVTISIEIFLMTYVLMPRITKLLSKWIYPSSKTVVAAN
jgi:hypothetical protein